MSNSYIPKRAVFIYAHADDIEFGVAGTAALWAKNGCEVYYILITDSGSGSHDPEMTRERLAAIRREEQQRSADIVGVKEVVFLGYTDGQLEPTLPLRKELVKWIRHFRPNVVVCGDPTTFFPNNTRINHPDHRAAATAAIDAVFPSADSHLIFPELVAAGYAPHKVNYVYISYPSQEPNLYIDISETLPLKVEALRAHKSQMKDWDPEQPLHDWSAGVGNRVGMAHAEMFRRITLNPDEPTDQEG
ncbi:MAG: PIG-L family deacetylase [Anaerolineae bacterium]|nr:PIG-L family deacetylase [Anaerolineae bacterium]MCO5192059.1 PIG-L family deacetylase [Anaerolineae bacterium]MCO5207715.1 PIG-L family deacetylase [Anaerolineae bacterium]